MTEKKWTCSWIRFIFLFTFTLIIDNMVMKLMKFLKKVYFAFLMTYTFTLIIVNIVMKSIYLHLSQYLLTSYWIIYICCHWYQHHEFFGTFSPNLYWILIILETISKMWHQNDKDFWQKYTTKYSKSIFPVFIIDNKKHTWHSNI